MPEQSIFDWVCKELQAATSLSELEVRGTVRLALKQSGLDARSVTGNEMAVVLRKVLPRELVGRAVTNALTLCEDLAARLTSEGLGGAGPAGGVEAVFRRLGGGGS